MYDLNKQIGGEAIHIRDCYVWAQIYYLDSATDYREHLVGPPPQQRSAVQGELLMLDDQIRFSQSKLVRGITRLFFIVLVLMLSACLLSSG
jgi:hypothetical protein